MKDIYLLIYGIIVFLIGLVAYFSGDIRISFNAKTYGIILVMWGVIIMINYLIARKRKK